MDGTETPTYEDMLVARDDFWEVLRRIAPQELASMEQCKGATARQCLLHLTQQLEGMITLLQQPAQSGDGAPKPWAEPDSVMELLGRFYRAERKLCRLLNSEKNTPRVLHSFAQERLGVLVHIYGEYVVVLGHSPQRR